MALAACRPLPPCGGGSCAAVLPPHSGPESRSSQVLQVQDKGVCLHRSGCRCVCLCGGGWQEGWVTTGHSSAPCRYGPLHHYRGTPAHASSSSSAVIAGCTRHVNCMRGRHTFAAEREMGGCWRLPLDRMHVTLVVACSVCAAVACCLHPATVMWGLSLACAGGAWPLFLRTVLGNVCGGQVQGPACGLSPLQLAVVWCARAHFSTLHCTASIMMHQDMGCRQRVAGSAGCPAAGRGGGKRAPYVLAPAAAAGCLPAKCFLAAACTPQTMPHMLVLCTPVLHSMPW